MPGINNQNDLYTEACRILQSRQEDDEADIAHQDAREACLEKFQNLPLSGIHLSPQDIVGSITQLTTDAPSDYVSSSSFVSGRRMISIAEDDLKELLEAAQPFADLANGLTEHDPDFYQVHVSYEDDSHPLHVETRTAQQLRRLLAAVVKMRMR